MRITQSRQILIIFFVPALLAVLLLIWFLQNSLHDQAIKQWSQDHYAFTNSLRQRLDTELQQARQLLEFTASLPEFQSLPALNQIDLSLNGLPPGVDNAKRHHLEQLLSHSNFSVLFVLTPKGDHYLSHPFNVQRTLTKYNLSDRPYFQKASSLKETVVSNRIIGADKIPAVVIDVPVTDSSGKIIAHLGGVLYLDQLSSLLSAGQIAPFNRAVLVDGMGNLIAGQTLAQTSALPPAVKEMSNNSGDSPPIFTSRLYNNDGQDWLTFRHKLIIGWELTLLREMGSLQYEIAPQARKLIWLAVGIVLFTSIIGALLALRFSRTWQRADAALKQTKETLAQRVKARTSELEHSETRHRILFESTADAVLLLNCNSFTDCNSAALSIFGAKDKTELLSCHPGDLSPALQADGSPSHLQAKTKIRQALHKGSIRFEWLHQRIDTGQVFNAEVLLSRMVIDGETLMQTTVRDITARKQAEERIHALSQVIEQSPVSVVITDISGNIEYVNSTFEKVTGYSEAEVLGKNPRLLKSGRTPAVRYQSLWAAISTGRSWRGEFQNCHKNGELFWEYAHISPVLDSTGNIRHFLAVKQNITLQKEQEEKILQQTHFDSLTGLPNRFLSLNQLDQIIKKARLHKEQTAVLFLDLDDFKKVNDTLGHETGDKLLIQAAARLCHIVRDKDIVGRLGGDEFILLLSDLADIADAESVADNLLACFRKPFRLDNRDLVLTASVGIAIFPNDGNTPAELLRSADTAMYHSKEQGRNRYHYFTESMNRDISRKLLLEEQLRTALYNKELSLNYQPVVDINTGVLIGAEALLRWTNPTLGQVSPDEFIPVAEHTGLIVEIGQFVIAEALKMTAHWSSRHSEKFRIAINLSPCQFRDSDLVPFIRQTLLDTGVDHANLELEITEGVLMGGHSHIDDALDALCQMGIAISMDDFGTGYSSLSYLRSYPFNTLKIDRSFINDISIDKADRELVNAAISMAHGLGLQVVAEGVETKEQLMHLASRQCNFAQGYFFSKPVRAEEITRMLKA
ncbi:MAG: bifunctional diguanylate cyclase/phosphodiesterase [Pontibacterium sp.]